MTDDVQGIEPEAEDTEALLPKAAPIFSRFLFVDVAAQRAKQLRRGARPRVPVPGEGPVKLERVAMTEVSGGLIHYTLPPVKVPAPEGGA
jgi:DNA-directed RNA polymerase subunit K/omega